MILMVFQLKDILDQRLEELEKKLEGVKEDLEKDKKLVYWHLHFIPLIKPLLMYDECSIALQII